MARSLDDLREWMREGMPSEVYGKPLIFTGIDWAQAEAKDRAYAQYMLHATDKITRAFTLPPSHFSCLCSPGPAPDESEPAK